MKTIKSKNDNDINTTKKEDSVIKPVLDTPKKSGLINEFLWSCAGVNKHILRQCPSDYAKYAGIGGTILFTAIMAALSGGYALNFVFKDIYISIAFGIFWGLLIFNLDRFIVNTMYSDGKHTISWAELKSGFPRIIMAVFLGIVISTPLELRIFESEINNQLEKDKKDKIEEYVRTDKVLLDSLRKQRDILRDAPLDPQYVGALGSADLEVQQNLAELSSLRKKDEDLRSQISTLRNQIRTLQVSKKHNDSIKARQLISQRTSLQNELNQVRSKRLELDQYIRTKSQEYKNVMEKAQDQRSNDLAALDSRINLLDKKMNSSEVSYKEKLKRNFDGLSYRMKAFSEIRKEDISTDIAAWFIMMLFVIIETAPTFFKMMMQDGAYDSLLISEKHRVKVLSQKKMSDVNDYVNTEVKISTMKNEKRLEAEILANEEILKKIAAIQAELLSKSIDAWREEELRKIEEDPKSYLQVTIKPEKNKK